MWIMWKKEKKMGVEKLDKKKRMGMGGGKETNAMNTEVIKSWYWTRYLVIWDLSVLRFTLMNAIDKYKYYIYIDIYT